MDPFSLAQTVLAISMQSNHSNDTTESLSRNYTTQDNDTLLALTPVPISLQPFTLVSQVLSLAPVRDWIKLFLIGASIQLLRRLMSSAWVTVKRYFWVTVTVNEGEQCGLWILYWLSRHQALRTARTFDLSSRTFGVDTSALSLSGGIEDSDGKEHHVSFLPSFETTYSLWFQCCYVIVTRHQMRDSTWQTKNTLHIRMLTRNRGVLRDLVLQAKRQYLSARQNSIAVYMPSSSSEYWTLMCTMTRRPMSSIILDPGTINMVLSDAKDFLASKEWYAARGIPHRRGYLLYGPPGAGKTSLIHTIAGELDQDIYILSLTRLGMDDATLNSVISELPCKCIVLVEDIDAAFHQGIKRDIPDPEKQTGQDKHPQKSRPQKNGDSVSRITLSGLLNALDGIGAQEGRIFFATTNDYNALDPALCRPGRLDLHIEFKLASKYQCRELFLRFYLPSALAEGDCEDEDARKESDGGAGAANTPSAKQSTDLASQFAALIPDRAFSMATLQGYLMAYKSRPDDALRELPGWIAKKRGEKTAGMQSNALQT